MERKHSHSMNRKFFLICLSGFWIAAFAGAAQCAEDTIRVPKGPLIQSVESSFDFGTINPDDTVEHIFAITNGGTDTLRINDTQGSCECTTATIDNKIIPPGGEAKLKVRFAPGGKTGRVLREAYIYSNDIAEKEKKFRFTADVQARSGGQ